MLTLPKRFEDVKHIITGYDPCLCEYVTFLETAQGIIDQPVYAGTIEPRRLFCGTDEIDDPNVKLHPSGVPFIQGEGNSISIPVNDVYGFPFPESRPADFTVILSNLPDDRIFKHLDNARTVVIFMRDPQPGEIPAWLFVWIKTGQLPDRLQLKHKETHPHGQAQIGRLISDRTPEPIRAPARELKPTADAAAEPGRRSVGRKHKFVWIRPDFLELMEADGLDLTCIEIYRIIYNYRKYPETSRRQAADNIRLDKSSYTKIYLSQVVEYLKIRKADLIATARGDRRDQAKKIKTSERTVKRRLAKLHQLGYTFRWEPGRPKVMKDISAEKQARREQRKGSDSLPTPTKYEPATSKRQRNNLKSKSRQLEKADLPPYGIYLKRIKR